MGEPESIECAAEISKLVACEFPVFILLGLPEPLVPRLYSRDHQIADARQILGASRFRPSGDAARSHDADRRQAGRHGNCDRPTPDPYFFPTAHARTGSLESSLSSVIG